LSATFNGASGMVRIIAPFPDVENEELPTILFALTCA
jgi:hypothetical protein